jgi:hypothetical protein
MPVPIDPKLLNLFTLFWSYYQDHQQDQAALESPSVPGSAPEATGTLRIEQRLDQLLLVVQAMWSLLQEKTGLTDAELLARMTELDARDGATDGRVTKSPVKCAKCGAAVSRKFNRCLFCGEPYRGGSAFDTV